MEAEATARATAPPPAAAWRFDRFTLDLARGALLGPEGTAIPLRPKSFALLRLLVEHAGRLLDRDTILSAVWPDVVVSDEAVTQCVRDIRKALGDEGQRLLQTVPKRGYLLAAEVSPAGQATAEEMPPVEGTGSQGSATPGRTEPEGPQASPAAGPRPERRLAAILAADVVGYTRLTEQDEAGTLERLKAMRKGAIEPILARHGGRIVKLMGDGVLVEFPSASEAVQAAVEVQRAVGEHERDRPEAEKIAFRIGINLGDVVHEANGDILGEGVNLASRLEQLAEPGGVCTTRNVYEQARYRSAVGFAPMGRKRLKNITEPVEVWRVVPDGTAQRRRPPALRPKRSVLAAVAAALAVLVLAGGVAAWFWPSKQALPVKPSIAVLPLANFSGDTKWERLTDGLTEDIITGLARQPDLFVIARNSTMPYKGKPVDVRQVGRELGVRYVLESSLQADGGRIRVTAQLIDAASGGHVWAERYDRPEAELFAVQDEVVDEVVGALGGWTGRIAGALRAEAHRKAPASLEAYELYLIGLEAKHAFTREKSREAIASLRRAVELDPGFARGWAALGLAYNTAAMSGFSDDPLADNRLWVECTKKAVALDRGDALARANLALVRAFEGDIAAADAEYQAALSLAPNDADILALVAVLMPLTVGRTEEAIRHLEHAIALNPATPPWYFAGLGAARFAAGSYEAAIEALKRAPPGGEPLMYLALAEAMLGRTEEARKHAAQLTSESPSFTVEGYIRDAPIVPAALIATIREGATKAGLLPAPTQ
jgi:TolB-like protein/class 3 adenylate cyclase/tetratricopeptide (TPR) repeat protein